MTVCVYTNGLSITRCGAPTLGSGKWCGTTPSVRRPNPSRRGREDPKQPASSFQVSYGPSTAYASDHPAQYGPKIALDCLFIKHLQRWGERMDLYTRREGFPAATNEDESIFSSRGRREIARLAQADA